MSQRPRHRCDGAAMGAIVLDLRPGGGIGPFTLGMPICEALAQIEQQPKIYEVVHVKYHDEEPLKLDIVFSFPDHGFHLRFDPWSQRLRLIEVYDVKRLQMRYATSIIGGPSVLATFVAVYALFGPTFPGIYDNDRGVYTLFYPGLSFAFPIPAQYMDCCNVGEAELPLEFPDGTTPVTCRVSVYDSSADSKVGVGSLMNKASAPPLPSGSIYMEELHAKLGEEIWFTVGGQHIPFGASPQDVWTDLGRPCGIHQKQRLRLIEVYDVKRLQMRYATSIIGGPSVLATFVAVYALFGPAFAGIYDKDRGVYTLFYPGLSFAFPIPAHYMDCCNVGEAELPLEFPNGTTPVTCRVSVYDSSADSKVGVGSLMNKASAPPLPSDSIYMEELHAKLGEEIWFTVGGQHIPFGASPQLYNDKDF